MANKHDSGKRNQGRREREGREQFGNRAGQSRTASEWREMDRQRGGFDQSEAGRFGRERYESREHSRHNSGSFPMDDLAYDVVTILHEKSKGLEAFDRYLEDARGDDIEDLLEEIREQDERAIEELQEHLHRLLSGGGRHRRAA